MLESFAFSIVQQFSRFESGKRLANTTWRLLRYRNSFGDSFMNVRGACVIAAMLAALPSSDVLAQRRGPARKDQRAIVPNTWLSSLDDGMAESRRIGKPLMVVIRCQP